MSESPQVEIVVPVKNEEADLAPGITRLAGYLADAFPVTVLAYLDVDLSTDLNALLPLVAPLLPGHSDVAIGTRLARGSRVVRGPKREFISRSYNLLLRATLRAGFSDAQCGFKAIRAVATALGDLRGIARVSRGLVRGTLKVPRLRSAVPVPRRAADLARRPADSTSAGSAR